MVIIREILSPFFNFQIQPFSSSQARLLAVRRGALGDFILTLPALRALRESRPGAEIHLLTLAAYGVFAVHFGFADGWRSLDAAPAAALFREDAALEEEWARWLAGFDEIISWLPDRDEVFQRQLAACGAENFHQAPWLADGSGPAARQFGAIPGMPEISAVSHVLLPSGNAESGMEMEAGAGLLALHPGSGSPRKNWPFARWIEVMTAIQKIRPATRWLVVTGEVEQERLPAMRAALDAAGLPWESAHALDLISLTERLRPCAALLGHDSGVSHLASACGLPCFLLFGPTDPAIWAPATPRTRILRAADGDLNTLSTADVIQWLSPELHQLA
ncbi:MAG: glycosyltransferase family 9 protein [Verrucomicrobiota bacterium]